MPQHGAHADRIAVVVGDAEVEHRPTGGRGFDRMAECRHLMTHGFDHDVRPVFAGQLTYPPVTGGPRIRVDTELRCNVCAVDRIDTGDATGTRRLGRTREQQPDRALSDDADMKPVEVR